MDPDKLNAYKAWIKEHVRRHRHSVLGLCNEAVKEMKKAFPELEKVPGHVEDMYWGRRGHVWLKAEDGTIVDPTASQFPAIMEYIPWKPGDVVRVGKCMNCGEEIWRPVQRLDVAPAVVSACSKECEEAVLEDLR